VLFVFSSVLGLQQILSKMEIQFVSKAGMEGVDMEEAKQFIHILSKVRSRVFFFHFINPLNFDRYFFNKKGSRFHRNEQLKAEKMERKAERMLAKFEKVKAEEEDLPLMQLIDQKIAALELQRDLSKTYIHVDMDGTTFFSFLCLRYSLLSSRCFFSSFSAYYASVELLDRPDLVGKPVAVGSMDMLATSSYEARKYGVRAGLPGFLAIQLCPTLVILPLNFSKYRAVAERFRKIFAIYDPNFRVIFFFLFFFFF
jgi:hypothetical protein